jgi:hypothetical protein
MHFFLTNWTARKRIKEASLSFRLSEYFTPETTARISMKFGIVLICTKIYWNSLILVRIGQILFPFYMNLKHNFINFLKNGSVQNKKSHDNKYTYN